MRFTADRAGLLEAVARVQSAAGNGKTVPILGMVLLRAEVNRVVVRATDMSVEATAQASATVESEGSICVPASQLHDLLRSLPDGADLGFSIAPGDSRLSVVCGRSRFKLPVLKDVDFPVMPGDSGDEVRGVIDADCLARLIDKTLFAAAAEEARYYLKGVYLHVCDDGDGARLRAVATNGARLALADVACPPGFEALAPMIVPTRMAGELRRALGSLDCEVELSASVDRLRIDIGDRRLCGPNVTGAYPDYRRVIPDPECGVRLDLGLLRAAIRRVTIAAEAVERVKHVRLAFDPGVLTLSSRSAERGEATEEIAIEYDGPALQMGFNSTFLVEAAERIGGAHADIRFSTPNDPVLLLDPTDEAAKFVLMPVRG